MAHVGFCNGAQYLIGENERLKKSDKYSIFCAAITATTTKSPDELAILIAIEAANLHGWPTLDTEKSVYVVGKITIPSRRLIHSESLSSGKEFARRIVGLEYELTKSDRSKR